MSESNREFLVHSIADTRDTIRAIDVKLIGTLFLFAFPLTEVKLVTGAFLSLVDLNTFIGVLASVAIGCSWLIGIIASLLGIIALENPSDAVINDQDGKGTYFGNGLFQFSAWQCFLPWYCFERRSLAEWSQTVRHTKSEIRTELAYEQMKLVYIRNLKMRRQRVAASCLAFYLIVMTVALVIAVVDHSYSG